MRSGSLGGTLLEGFEALARTPPPPDAPWGSPDALRVVRPGRGYRRMRLWRWGLSQVIALTVVVLGLFGISFLDFGGLERVIRGLMLPLEALALLILPFEAILTLIPVLLDARYRWYLITDRSLRIREGLWTVREMTISLANIQHVGLRQGPVERFFGVATLEVRTAGGGNKELGEDESTMMHIGLLRGVEDAEALRDELVARWHDARRAHESETTAAPADDPLAALDVAGRAVVAASSGLLRSARGALEQVAPETGQVRAADQGHGHA